MHVTSWKQDCYVGIIIMMGKRIVCIISVLVFAAFGLWASFATRPSVSAWFGAVFCHPTADYLKEYPGDPSAETPPFRTSQSFGFDLDVLNVAFVFNEKNILRQIDDCFGLKKNEYPQFVLRLLHTDCRNSLLQALKYYLPEEIPPLISAGERK